MICINACSSTRCCAEADTHANQPARGASTCPCLPEHAGEPCPTCTDSTWCAFFLLHTGQARRLQLDREEACTAGRAGAGASASPGDSCAPRPSSCPPTHHTTWNTPRAAAAARYPLHRPGLAPSSRLVSGRTWRTSSSRTSPGSAVRVPRRGDVADLADFCGPSDRPGVLRGGIVVVLFFKLRCAQPYTAGVF